MTFFQAPPAKGQFRPVFFACFGHFQEELTVLVP
jgi:hypothetical protein